MLLALDTATRKIGIALYDGVQVLHESVWQSPNRHTVELIPAISQALAQNNISIDQIEVIGLAIGPGSYTGLRIGAATAKGLALAQCLDIVTVSTFEIMAAAIPVQPDLQLAVVLEAGRGRLSIGWFEAGEGAWQPAKAPDLFTSEEFSKKIRVPTVVCGELDEETRKLLGRKFKNVILASPANSLRRPAYLAELAWARWQAGEITDPAEVAPIYLQTDASIPA